MMMTVPELVELIDAVVEAPTLNARIENARTLRFRVVEALRLSEPRGAPLSKRQTEILRFLVAHRQEFGYAPLLSEIGACFGITETTVYEHLEALEQKGYIRRVPSIARGIELLSPAEAIGA